MRREMEENADFYVVTSGFWEWIGSIRNEGRPTGAPRDALKVASVQGFRAAVAHLLVRTSGLLCPRPEKDGPYPAFAYAWLVDLGGLHVSVRGGAWQTVDEYLAHVEEKGGATRAETLPTEGWAQDGPISSPRIEDLPEALRRAREAATARVRLAADVKDAMNLLLKAGADKMQAKLTVQSLVSTSLEGVYDHAWDARVVELVTRLEAVLSEKKAPERGDMLRRIDELPASSSNVSTPAPTPPPAPIVFMDGDSRGDDVQGLREPLARESQARDNLEKSFLEYTRDSEKTHLSMEKELDRLRREEDSNLRTINALVRERNDAWVARDHALIRVGAMETNMREILGIDAEDTRQGEALLSMVIGELRAHRMDKFTALVIPPKET